MERLCEYCGKPLPPNSSPRKKYHSDCAKIVNSKKTANNQKEKKEYAGAFRLKLSEADRAYCRGCIYNELHNPSYLCNYILIEKRRRGCKPGVGCNKRKYHR